VNTKLENRANPKVVIVLATEKVEHTIILKNVKEELHVKLNYTHM